MNAVLYAAIDFSNRLQLHLLVQDFLYRAGSIYAALRQGRFGQSGLRILRFDRIFLVVGRAN